MPDPKLSKLAELTRYVASDVRREDMPEGVVARMDEIMGWSFVFRVVRFSPDRVMIKPESTSLYALQQLADEQRAADDWLERHKARRRVHGVR